MAPSRTPLLALLGLALLLAFSAPVAAKKKSSSKSKTSTEVAPPSKDKYDFEVELVLRANETDSPTSWGIWMRNRKPITWFEVVLRITDEDGPEPTFKEVALEQHAGKVLTYRDTSREESPGHIVYFSPSGATISPSAASFGGGSMSFERHFMNIILDDDALDKRPCIVEAFVGFGVDSDGNILRALVADEQRTKWVPVDDDQKKALKVKLPRCGGDKFQGLVLDMEDKLQEFIDTGNIDQTQAFDMWNKERDKNLDQFLEYEKAGKIKMNPFGPTSSEPPKPLVSDEFEDKADDGDDEDEEEEPSAHDEL